MPITQDRMIALVNAGLDYRQALDRAVDLIRLALSAVHDGESPERQLEDLTLLVTVGSLLNSDQSTATLLIEQRHFKQSRARNTRRADKQRALRTEAGITPANTAPITLLSDRSLMSPAQAEERYRAAALRRNGTRLKFPGLSAEQKASLEAEAERDMAAELLLNLHDRDGAMQSILPAPQAEPPVETSFIPEDNDDTELTLEGIAPEAHETKEDEPGDGV